MLQMEVSCLSVSGLPPTAVSLSPVCMPLKNCTEMCLLIPMCVCTCGCVCRVGVCMHGCGCAYAHACMCTYICSHMMHMQVCCICCTVLHMCVCAHVVPVHMHVHVCCVCICMCGPYGLHKSAHAGFIHIAHACVVCVHVACLGVCVFVRVCIYMLMWA